MMDWNHGAVIGVTVFVLAQLAQSAVRGNPPAIPHWIGNVVIFGAIGAGLAWLWSL